MIQTIQQTSLDKQQREAARQLWNNEYPASLKLETDADFEKYLDNLSDKTHYLVMENDRILGWGMTFIRESDVWFAMILDHSIHKKGIGSSLLKQMRSAHPVLLGWVIDHGYAVKTDGSLYVSPLPFYEKNGCVVEPKVRLEAPAISAVRISFK